jgi:poly(3-hydroxybutyrate) depolymerase
VNSEQRHFEVKGAGHYGIFSGRRWRELVYPEVKSFILQHHPQASAAPIAKSPSKASAKVSEKGTRSRAA